MLPVKFIGIVILSSLIFCGCSRTFALDSIQTGSNASNKGIITEEKTEFSFSFDKKGTMKDLFNYIYFQGDTLCFSADFSKDLAGTVTVFFIDPVSKVRVKAERLEIVRSRAWGFSLVGSLLEYFHKDSLGNTVPKDGVITQPYLIEVHAEQDGVVITREHKGEFTVSW